MAKKVESSFKLQIPAGKANPSPPVGPALGQRGVNIMEFCKTFNAQTQSLEPGQPCPVVVTVFTDKSFALDVKTPPATFLILKALNKTSGASNTGTQVIGSISMDQVREIAEIKMKDLNAFNMDQACKIIAGSARSMGVNVAED